MPSQRVVVQVIYPTSSTSKFSMDYYLNHHIPLVKSRWGHQGLQSWTVTAGVKDTGYDVQATMVWKDMEAFTNAKDVDEVRADIKNFTDVTPYRWVGLLVDQEELGDSAN
ncbi:hypothetical protein BDV27DRAFT_131007 [Aspergillus caelatus]|uniref:EthD domain-containing protein n=2 Tax=Aspergillus subgen. Circumdati TaxID=2720871 RepID=A0A5N6ZYS1_9EURO|nr:uncharacterized protein BDV27DRAFT_131007 [Aspergillus caelatus]KAE8362744.1 hypothetical protein BDV27DRAFT_131007 [Aspergillus caelatus]KAE8410633.1 hypothetical protein BDV36DRAFT_302569 [Aspergillus pseudocaelatus]